MKKILCIINSLNRGGAETFMVKLCNNIDRDKYRIDFCVKSKDEGAYEKELTELGCRIFHTAMRTENPIKCFCDIVTIVKRENYKSVLLISEFSVSAIDLIAARLGGAKKCSMRSTNASFSKIKSRIFHKIFKPLSMCIPDMMIAPSSEAGRFTFGKKNMESGKVNILRNGLSCEKYDFSKDARNRIRSAIGIENRKIVCHVGRFSHQKNHTFLIDVFENILKIDTSACLLLVGTGGKKTEIEEKTKALGIDDKVIFLGERNDVPEILSAADILIFPSLYEGMPNVVIEAQAAGLPCIISDTITPEADITGLVKYMSLSETAESWASQAMGFIKESERRSYINEIYQAGYDIGSVVEKFANWVF